MKTAKIDGLKVKLLADLQAIRNTKNTAIKAEKELMEKVKAEIPELSGEIALLFNGNVIATNALSTRKTVSVELLRQTYPKIAEEMTVESSVSTLKILI